MAKLSQQSLFPVYGEHTAAAVARSITPVAAVRVKPNPYKLR